MHSYENTGTGLHTTRSAWPLTPLVLLGRAALVRSVHIAGPEIRL